MLSCVLDYIICSWCHSYSDRLISYSLVYPEQRCHCSTAWFRCVSSSNQFDLISFLLWIGAFILIYTVNISDVNQSMIIDRIRLANKVNKSFVLVFFYCRIILVNGKIQSTKNHCSQYSVHIIDNDWYKATATIRVNTTNENGCLIYSKML